MSISAAQASQPAPGPAAGPSKPRKLSLSSSASLGSPSRTKLRSSNDHLAHYGSDDESSPLDSLPGYASAQSQSQSQSHKRQSSEVSPKAGHIRTGSSSRHDAQERSGLLGQSEINRTAGSGKDGNGHAGDGHAGRDSDAAGGPAGPRLSEGDAELRLGLGRAGEQDMPIGLEMSLAQRKVLWLRNTVITGIFVLSWYGSATLLSLYNKWMFSPQYYNFPFPLFVTGCHMVVQFVLAATVRRVWAERYRPPERPTRQDYASKIFPTAVSTAGDIGLSNLSLRTITLSLYTMCKSSALIFVLLFAFLFRLEHFSLHLISVITLISLGVFLMVYDVTAVSIPGVIMVFTASALSGLRWGLTELLMKKRKMGLGNPFATIFWLAPMMAITLLPVSAGVEGWGNVFGNGHWDGGNALFTVGVIAFPGVIAFTMVASEYFIIDRAGILPLSVAGVFKEVTTISFSAWIFGDELTELNLIGVAVAVCGIALYAYHKYQKAMSTSESLSDDGVVGDRTPLVSSAHHSRSGSHSAPIANKYAPAATEPDLDIYPSPSPAGGLPMSQLPSTSSRDREHAYPPPGAGAGAAEVATTEEELTQKRRDDFEGWNDNWGDDDGYDEDEEDEDEVDEEEVLKRRGERTGGHDAGGEKTGGSLWSRSWGEWWDKEM